MQEHPDRETVSEGTDEIVTRTKPVKNRRERRAVTPPPTVPPLKTGTPSFWRQAAFEVRSKLAYDVQQLGIDTSRMTTLKQVRMAVARAKLERQAAAGYQAPTAWVDEATDRSSDLR